MEEEEKYLTRRCPRLGGPVSLHYCKKGGSEQAPCWKIIDCWWEIFDIEAYLRDTLTATQYERLLHKKPKPKLACILEIVDKVRN